MWWAQFGYYLCVMGLILSVHGVMTGLLCAAGKGEGWWVSSRRAITLCCGCVWVAACLLWWKFYQRDYSLIYVYKNASQDLPPFYTLTALWSSLEGSHLLWSGILSVFCTLAVHTVSSSHRALAPYLGVFSSGVMVWMFLLLVTYSNPFLTQFPAPENGLGMNALLQNPYMAFHPPTLFVGYSALVGPYAYAMAALCRGQFLPGWVRVMKQWLLCAWIFLTVGIALGGRWAYVELGWGGYWAWDPVENSSLIPWLLATGLLHGLMMQEKLGALGKVNIALAVLAFFSSFFGTFLTRSGIITSVHSFAQSDIGWVYLIYLLLLLAFSGGLFIVRASQPGLQSMVRGYAFSKELVVILGIFILCVFAGVVAIGTLYPVVSEVIGGVRLNVQAPYFNTFAPWVGALLALFLALGSVLYYHVRRLTMSLRTGVLVVVITSALTLLFTSISGIGTSSGSRLYIQVGGIGLIAFTLVLLVQGFFRRFHGKTMSWYLIRKNLGYMGGFVAHIGFLIALMGFLGNYRGMERSVSLDVGESVEMFGYTLEYVGQDTVQQDNAVLTRAAMVLRRNGVFYGVLSPARSRYATKTELLHEVAVYSEFWHDIYLVLSDPPSTQNPRITLQVYVNPLVKLVWLAVLVMVLGGGLSLWGVFYERKKSTKKPTTAA